MQNSDFPILHLLLIMFDVCFESNHWTENHFLALL